MTEEQIRNYFGNYLIYEFDAQAEELSYLLPDNSINYITSDYKTYFISDKIVPVNSRIKLFADNTQGVK
jgi:hypothetical protein